MVASRSGSRRMRIKGATLVVLNAVLLLDRRGVDAFLTAKVCGTHRQATYYQRISLRFCLCLLVMVMTSAVRQQLFLVQYLEDRCAAENYRSMFLSANTTQGVLWRTIAMKMFCVWHVFLELYSSSLVICMRLPIVCTYDNSS